MGSGSADPCNTPCNFPWAWRQKATSPGLLRTICRAPAWKCSRPPAAMASREPSWASRTAARPRQSNVASCPPAKLISNAARRRHSLSPETLRTRAGHFSCGFAGLGVAGRSLAAQTSIDVEKLVYTWVGLGLEAAAVGLIHAPCSTGDNGDVGPGETRVIYRRGWSDEFLGRLESSCLPARQMHDDRTTAALVG